MVSRQRRKTLRHAAMRHGRFHNYDLSKTNYRDPPRFPQRILLLSEMRHHIGQIIAVFLSQARWR